MSRTPKAYCSQSVQSTIRNQTSAIEKSSIHLAMPHALCPIPATRYQRTEDRRQIVQHPPRTMPHAPCPMPASRSPYPATRTPHPATRTPYPATRNARHATRNPHPVTRNAHRGLFFLKLAPFIVNEFQQNAVHFPGVHKGKFTIPKRADTPDNGIIPLL